MQLGLDNSLQILNEFDDKSSDKNANDIIQVMITIFIVSICMVTAIKAVESHLDVLDLNTRYYRKRLRHWSNFIYLHTVQLVN